MSQEQRRRSARRGSVWRTITAIAGAAAMVTAMAALAPAANAGGNGKGHGGPGNGGGSSYQGDGPGYICHANNGIKDFVKTPVDIDAIFSSHSGNQGTHGADIIPPFDYQEWSNELNRWVDQSYSGKNWDGNEAFWGNSCRTPTPPETYTVTVNKNWIGAKSGDKATIKINDSGSDNNATAQVNDSSTNSGVVSQPSLKENDSVTITEDESQGNERDYTSTLACYADADHTTPWSPVSLGTSFDMPKKDLYCVVTNTGEEPEPEPDKPTVTVNKVWKINGDVVDAATAKARGLTATPTIKAGFKKAETKEWGVQYSYDKDTWLTLGENVSNTGDCVVDLFNSRSVRPFKLTQDTEKTFTNAYLCSPQITITKQWMINGKNASFDEAKALGLSATPTVSVKIPFVGYGPAKEVGWNKAYSDWYYSLQPTLRINENVVNESNGTCTVDSERSTSLPKTVTLKADTTIDIVNAYNCVTTPEVPTVRVNLYKEWVDATGNPVTALTIASGETSNAENSTWDGSSSTGFAHLEVPIDALVSISEAPGANYPSNYSASWACYPADRATPKLRTSSFGGGAFLLGVPGYYGDPVDGLSGNTATPAPFAMPDYDLDCFFTNTRTSTPPTTTTSRPTPVEPSYGAQCTVGDTGDQITVTVPQVVSGIRYVVDGQGTDSVTITASPADTAHIVTVPTGWTASGNAATITVTSTSPETLTCVASEEQEESPAEQEQPPAEEEQGESATKPDTTVEVKGESQEAVTGAPSATAKTGESGPAYWTYLTLAAGVLLLLGSARIRRRDNGA